MTQNPQKNLKLLLCHEEEVNIQLGLQILSNQPEKQAFATSLLALAYFHPNKELRSETREIFKKMADAPLLNCVRKMHQKIVGYQAVYHQKSNTIEKSLARQLRQLSAFEMIDQEELGNLILNFTGMGIRFCVEQAIPIWNLGFEKVIHLDLSGLQDKVVTDYLYYFPHTLSLDLSNNELKHFPSEIFRFSELRWLNISNNQIPSLPESIDNLAELEYLDVSQNRLKKLPDNICSLHVLQQLNLKQNLLRTLPHKIGENYWLYDFNVSHNLLSEIPVSLNRFTYEHETCLSNNLLAPNIWVVEEQSKPDVWIGDGEWNSDFIDAQASFLSAEEKNDHIFIDEWNTRDASQISFAEQILNAQYKNPAMDQWQTLNLILVDDLLNKVEKAEYVAKGLSNTELSMSLLPSQQLSYQSIMHYSEDDTADFLQSQTQVKADIWAMMYETGLHIRYFAEGAFHDDYI